MNTVFSTTTDPALRVDAVFSQNSTTETRETCIVHLVGTSYRISKTVSTIDTMSESDFNRILQQLVAMHVTIKKLEKEMHEYCVQTTENNYRNLTPSISNPLQDLQQRHRLAEHDYTLSNLKEVQQRVNFLYQLLGFVPTRVLPVDPTAFTATNVSNQATVVSTDASMDVKETSTRQSRGRVRARENEGKNTPKPSKRARRAADSVLQ